MGIGDHVKKYLAEKEAAAHEAKALLATDDEAPEPSPTKPAKAPAMTQNDFLIAMQQLIAAIKSNDDPTAKERAVLEAERLALEHERLKREMPENKQATGISVFSYPEGELKRPKPALKCKMFWCGPEERPEQLTPEEVELRNRLVPGNYRVTKANGVSIPFTVEGKYDNGGNLEELVVWYPCRDEHMHDHLPNTAYLRQVLGEHVPSVDDALTEVARLKAQLAGAAA